MSAVTLYRHRDEKQDFSWVKTGLAPYLRKHRYADCSELERPIERTGYNAAALAAIADDLCVVCEDRFLRENPE